MSRECTEAEFLKDVATHEMEVLADHDLTRYITFRRPGTYCMGFNITTWPGYLCISGDMGTFVFTRLPDMFEFFRANKSRGPGLQINLSYWSEKVVAVNKSAVGTDSDGIKQYDADIFRRAIADRLADYFESHNHSDAEQKVLRQSVVEMVLFHADDGEHAARQAAHDFEYLNLTFQDFHESNCREYSYHFIWCCYAIAWAVDCYDRGVNVKS